MYRTLREEAPNAALFEFLYHAVWLLDTKEQGIAAFHLVFLLHFSRFLGFFPADITSPDELAYLPELNVFSNMQPDVRSLLFSLMNTSLAQTETVSLTHAQMEYLLDRILAFYRQQVDSMGKLNSLQVLREIFME
jgi:DNA repair protein RecO (recombination protein O)